MSESREYPGAFDEVINTPPTERQRKPRVNGHGIGGDQTISTLSRDDFYAYMPTHKYMFAPSRQLWPGRSVNALASSRASLLASGWMKIGMSSR